MLLRRPSSGSARGLPLARARQFGGPRATARPPGDWRKQDAPWRCCGVPAKSRPSVPRIALSCSEQPESSRITPLQRRAADVRHAARLSPSCPARPLTLPLACCCRHAGGARWLARRAAGSEGRRLQQRQRCVLSSRRGFWGVRRRCVASGNPTVQPRRLGSPHLADISDFSAEHRFLRVPASRHLSDST